jgi:V-type H+-transporting ATPase subunit C
MPPFPRPHRFIVRDFTYAEEEIQKQRAELDEANTTEKELWVRIQNITCFQLHRTYPLI